MEIEGEGERASQTDPDHPFVTIVAETARAIHGKEPLIMPTMAGSAIERLIVVAFDDRGAQLEPRHVEHADQSAMSHPRGRHAFDCRRVFKRCGLLGLESAGFDRREGIDAQAADPKAEQQPLEEVGEPCCHHFHRRASGDFWK